MRQTIRWMVAPVVLVALATACSKTETRQAERPAITSGQLEPRELGTIARLHVQGDVFLASQPKSLDFAEAGRAGVKTVINLRHTAEIQDFDEQQLVEAAGMRYLTVPFEGPAELTDAVFDSVREQLKSVARPVLLHCSSANRVGAVWLPYRVLDGGLSYDEALAEAKTVGLRSAEYEAKARAYVETHK